MIRARDQRRAGDYQPSISRRCSRDYLLVVGTSRLIPFIVRINHLLAMRLDAYKLCRGRRLAQKTGCIGVWEHVLHIVTVIAVFTNSALAALTSSLASGTSNELME